MGVVQKIFHAPPNTIWNHLHLTLDPPLLHRSILLVIAGAIDNQIS